MRIIADTHTHTIASDHAFSTVVENATCGKAAGLKFMAITDHGVRMPDSPHLWHFYSLGVLPREIKGVTVIRGIEANIMDFDGGLDIPEDVYASLEWIIASYHHPCCMPGTFEQHTNSYIKVLKNPRVDVIGHCDTKDFDFDFDAVAKVCHEENKLIEVNNSRLYNAVSVARYKEILKACQRHKTQIILNSDAHYCERVGDLSMAIKLVEEIGFPENLVVNADENRFANYLKSRGKNII